MPTCFRTIITEPGKVELQPQEVAAPKAGQVLLRTICTLISTGTELNTLVGKFPAGARGEGCIRYPTSVGYSSVATVTAAGEGVENVQPGDRVASLAPHATEAVYPADALWRVPDNVDSDSAAFATLAEIALGGVRRSRLVVGESVVIVGAGLVGQLTAQFCRIAGAWPVILVDPAPARLMVAGSWVGLERLNLSASDARPDVDQLTGGRMADVVFEATGVPAAIPGSIRLARPLGRVVLVGSPRGSVTVDFYEDVHSFGVEIIGAHNRTHPSAATYHNPWTQGRHVELFLDWLAAGVVDVHPLITHHFPWRQTPEAYAMLLKDRSQALGVILDWSDPASA